MASNVYNSFDDSEDEANSTSSDDYLYSMEINYDAYKNGWVKVYKRVESVQANTDVILFGEGNFTFSVALAAIQGGWSRITSTRYEPDSLWNPKPSIEHVKEECKTYCRKNGGTLSVDPDTIKENIKAIEGVQTPEPTHWLCGVNATNLRRDLTVKGKVAWFQCPWVELPRCTPTRNSGTLMTDFLTHMATKQARGDYVLIGICTKFPYVKSYYLASLLDFTQEGAPSKCSPYAFVGADNSFIKKILQFGYHHQGVTDIHDDIIREHITLIFKKK